MLLKINQQKALYNQFKEKSRRLETDLKTLINARYQVEIEKNLKIDNLSQEICELVMDNMVQSLQMKEFQNYVKQIIDLREDHLSIFENNLHPLKQWLSILSSSQISHNKKFNNKKFDCFIDNLSLQVNDFYSSARLYEKFYNNELITYERKISNQKLKSTSSSISTSLSSKTTSIKSQNSTNEEVLKVMDYMIFLVEIENEIESQINIDLSIVNLDKYIDNKINGSSYASPSKYASQYFSKGSATPKKFTNLEEVPAVEIFKKRYDQRIQKQFENFDFNHLSIDFVYCNTKLLDKIFTINKEMVDYLSDNKHLIVELTKLFANTYNLCLYLTNKL